MHAQPDTSHRLSRGELAATALTVLVLLLSISGESFWTDEVTTATFASQPDYRGFWDSLSTTGSEMQMPLYAHYMWAWARVFGTGELALRCANIPWMALLVAGWVLLLKRHRTWGIAVLLLAAPLVSMQMNEARPYIMTMATSALALLGLERMLAAHRQGLHAGGIAVWGFALATWACVAISMLNLFVLPALLAYALVCWKDDPRGLLPAGGSFVRAHRGVWVGLALGLTGLVGYFLWTLRQGHGGMPLPFTLTNLGFAIYEWAGFGGLGVPRNVLREIGPAAAARAAYPTLVMGVLAWLVAGAHLWRERRRLAADPAVARPIWGGKAGAWLLILAAVVMPASIWGRHFLFAWPFIWLGLARWMVPAPDAGPASMAGGTSAAGGCGSASVATPAEREARGAGGRQGVGGTQGARGAQGARSARHPYRSSRLGLAAFLALIVVFLISSGRQRIDPAFGKDPYREAVEALRGQLQAYRELPWVWVTYPKALRLYGGQIVDRNAPLAADESQGRPALVLGDQWGAEDVRDWTGRHPDFLLVLHRPEVTDPEGAWRRLTATAGERLWERGNIRIYRIRAGSANESGR